MINFSEHLDIFWRLSAVYFFMFLLFIFNTVSLPLPGMAPVEIPFIITTIYYWSIYRPTLIPSWLIFLAGLIFDLLSGLPLGLSAFIFLAVRWLVTDQRLFLTGQPFVTVWIGFIVVCTAAIVLQWGLYGLINLDWTPFKPAAAMILLGTFLFPVMAMTLHLSHKFLPFMPGQYSAAKLRGR